MAYQELPGVGRPLMPSGRDIMNILEASPPTPMAPAGAMGRLFNALLGQRGGVDLPFTKLPPWLVKLLPGEYQVGYKGFTGHYPVLGPREPDPIQMVMAKALSKDPLNPVEALRRYKYTKDLSDEERAAMTIAHAMLGGLQSEGGKLVGGRVARFQPTVALDLDRLLLPKQRYELKTWAHDVLQKAAQRKEAQQASRQYWNPLDWEGSNYPQAGIEDLIKALLSPGTKEIVR